MDGEGIRGYALRVDFENTVRLFTPNLGGMDKACRALSELEVTTGRKLTIFLGGVFLNEVNRENRISEYFSGYKFYPPWVSDGLKRICPNCLSEQGFMQGIWELQVIDSCLVHGCRLISHCNTCGETLDWTGGTLTTCRCGARLSDLKSISVGPLRHALDMLLVEILYSNAKDKVDPFESNTQQSISRSIESSFVAIAVIAFHIAPRIAYAITSSSEAEVDEQRAGFALRLVDLGHVGIAAALFSVLGNEMQDLNSSDRAWLLCQDEHRREMLLAELFQLNWSIRAFQFVRHILLPTWDEAHRKWLSTVDQSIVEYIGKCDPVLTQSRGLDLRRKKSRKWSVWDDPRRVRLIERLGRRLRKLEGRNETR